jgi:phospholipid N-methyltransferase
MSVSNFFLLWRQILRNPRDLGTVAPSSQFLAKCLVEAADLAVDQRIVEVGAGTGPLTKWIRPKISPESFIALEPNGEMSATLRREFPDIQVFEEKVQRLEQICQDLGWDHVDKVLSSLPWSLFSEESQEEALRAIASSLNPQGRMLTLVYSHAQYFPSSAKLEQRFHKYFHHVYRTRTTWRNLPPGYWLVGERPKIQRS